MVWRVFGISVIITDEISPVKEFIIALGLYTQAGCVTTEKKSPSCIAMAVAGILTSYRTVRYSFKDFLNFLRA
jgi:hypothetical protein